MADVLTCFGGRVVRLGDGVRLAESLQNYYTRCGKICGVKLRVYCLEVLISMIRAKETKVDE